MARHGERERARVERRRSRCPRGVMHEDNFVTNIPGRDVFGVFNYGDKERSGCGICMMRIGGWRDGWRGNEREGTKESESEGALAQIHSLAHSLSFSLSHSLKQTLSRHEDKGTAPE